MSDDTGRRGIVGSRSGLECGVNTQHHPHRDPTVLLPATLRCLRHHVWMAACGDCRAARAVPTVGRGDGTERTG